VATASHVTRAHLNRIPESVGVWRFDPDSGEREVVRDPDPLPVDEAGIEVVAERPGRTDVALVDAAAKRRIRRRVAERAYGKGWRPSSYPACTHCEPTDDGRPHCAEFDRVVHPADDCGASCPARDPADPPAVDVDALRDDRTPWVHDPEGTTRRQAGLDRFG
jgi:hypothetical protein